MDEILRSQSYAELLSLDIPPANPVIEGFIDEGAGVILAGPPGIGKTWVELSMARAIAAGETWVCHFKAKQGPVLIIDEESHIRGLQNRLQMMENAHPIGSGAPIHFAVGHGIRLDSHEGFARADALIAMHKPIAVFVDSMTRVHGADENSAGQMADFFRNGKTLMRTHGVALIFLDHLRKKGLLNDPEEMLRGSTEKRAWPDSIMFLAPADRDQIQVSHIKSRFSEKIPDFRIKIEVNKDLQTAEVLHDGAAPAQETSKANEIIAAIHALHAQLGPDGADDLKISAWIECSPDTVARHTKKLVSAEILAIRTVHSSERGGRPRKVYDVKGGSGR